MSYNVLPGRPSKLLVSRVRARLKRYGIVPAKEGKTWLESAKIWVETWAWAWAVAESYDRFLVLTPAQRARHRWPASHEIATQYVVLMLAAMKDGHDLKLPFRASEFPPPRLAALAAGQTKPPLALVAAGLTQEIEP